MTNRLMEWRYNRDTIYEELLEFIKYLFLVYCLKLMNAEKLKTK